MDNTGDPENLKLLGLSFGESAIVAWEELHNFSKDIYFNKVNQDGTLEFSSSVALTSADNDQSNIEIIRGNNSGGTDKALIVWEDFANGIDFNITGQIIDVNNMELIGDNIAICHEDLYQGSPTLAYDGDGRFIVAWEDERGVDNGDPVLSGGLDVYIQIITEESLLYPEGGVTVVSEYHDQSSPQLTILDIEDGDYTWLLHWVDMRSSGKADLKNLYTQGIEFVESSIEDGVIPKEFTVSQAYPNPFNGNVAIDVTIAEVEPVTFSITNILGQKVFQQTLLPDHAGSFRINWNGRDILQRDLPSGIYIYSVMTNTNIVNGKCTYLK